MGLFFAFCFLKFEICFMLSSNKIKFINALKLKKNRAENGLFIAEGPKVVNDLIANHYPVSELFATNEYIENNPLLQKEKKITLTAITTKELGRISALTTPNQVLALCNTKEYILDLNELLPQWSFVLDGINDPGNLGTIIRIAHWFSIKNIICSHDTVDVYNAKTVQSTMGSLAYAKIIYTDLTPFLRHFENKITVLGTFMKGRNIYDVDLKKQGLIVFGSESHGISKEIEKHISLKVSIPSTHSTSHPDSLNVAVSAGIIAAELQRQNLLK